MSVSPHRSMLSRRALLGTFLASALPATSLHAASPIRIVSLDYGIASTLLALGIAPIAISELADWDKWVDDPAMPAGVVDLGSSLELNFEILLALKPDLILTTPYLDDLLPQLRSIAPVSRLDIYSEDSGPSLPAAIKATRALGRDIGRQSEAEAYLQRADALFDDCRNRLSRIAPPPIALVDFLEARHVRIYSAPGMMGSVLERIGLRNAWRGEANYWGFQTVAIEQLSAITDPDARLVVFDPIPPDVLPALNHSPLWRALPIAKPGHLLRLPAILLFGMVNEAERFARLLTALLEAKA